ncbi:MAG: hypothetical protein JO253_03135 [Alphaproteobacteria bacterium]|nr:hypothetical protein [Alphaproteobacteria bacterium]
MAQAKKSTRYPNDSSGGLFDAIKKAFDIDKEYHLATFAGIDYTRISKVRHGVNQVTDSMIVSILRATGWDIKTVDKYLKGKS